MARGTREDQPTAWVDAVGRIKAGAPVLRPDEPVRANPVLSASPDPRGPGCSLNTSSWGRQRRSHRRRKRRARKPHVCHPAVSHEWWSVGACRSGRQHRRFRLMRAVSRWACALTFAVVLDYDVGTVIRRVRRAYQMRMRKRTRGACPNWHLGAGESCISAISAPCGRRQQWAVSPGWHFSAFRVPRSKRISDQLFLRRAGCNSIGRRSGNSWHFREPSWPFAVASVPAF